MPHKHAAVLMVGIIFVAGSAHANEAYATTRVRSKNAPIARLIRQATQRSATFRREIEAITGTDALVYVPDAQCGRGVQTCLMHTVELAGPYKHLRVTPNAVTFLVETVSPSPPANNPNERFLPGPAHVSAREGTTAHKTVTSHWSGHPCSSYAKRGSSPIRVERKTAFDVHVA
jgi:hypothetical protein